MSITFGIITAGNKDGNIKQMVDQIHKQNIPEYEIIIVGESSITGQAILNIPFDESIKRGWITRKKNIIANRAKYDNIVMMHDYISLNDRWYENFLKFGTNFDICIHPLKTIDGERFRDLIFFHSFRMIPFQNKFNLPYNCEITDKIQKLLYVSGTYYIIKKNLAILFPLDESLVHNMGEDVILCLQLIMGGYKISFNPYCVAKLLKHKENPDDEITDESVLNLINSLSMDTIDTIVLQSYNLQKRWINKQKI